MHNEPQYNQGRMYNQGATNATIRQVPGQGTRVKRQEHWAGVQVVSANSSDYKPPHKSCHLNAFKIKENMVQNATSGLAGTVGENPSWKYCGQTGPAPVQPETTTKRYVTMGKTITAPKQERFPIKGLIKEQFYSPGHASISEEGQMQAEAFFKYARPWQGLPPISYASKTSQCGTPFNIERFYDDPLS